MPIYECRCEACGHLFEHFSRGMTAAGDQTAPPCPECSGGPATRVISAVAFIKQGTPGIGRAAYPTSWEQLGGGDPDTIRHWQRRVERDQKEEARHPELVKLREEAASVRWRQVHPEPDGSAGQTPDWRQIPFIKPEAAHSTPHKHHQK